MKILESVDIQNKPISYWESMYETEGITIDINDGHITKVNYETK